MSKFKKSVIKVVSSVPKGKVVSYGQVAFYAGIPRAARQVGWILNRLEEPKQESANSPQNDSGQVPWWRVVNNKGRISIKNFKYSAEDQKRLLVNEGVKVGDDFTFDIDKYRYKPSEKELVQFGLEPSYLDMISSKVVYSKYF